MKLIECPNCKNKINAKEKVCPVCNEPIRKKIEVKYIIIIVVVSALIGYFFVFIMKESKMLDNISLKKMYCTKINNSNDYVSCVLLYNYKSYLKKGSESYDGNNTMLKINKHKYKIYTIDNNIIKELDKKKYIYAMTSVNKIHNLSKKNSINLVAEFAISKKDLSNIKEVDLMFKINDVEISKKFNIKDIDYKDIGSYEELYKNL